MRDLDYSQIKKIHFVGIKGVGMTPLAIIAKEAGFAVSGCDSPDIFITDKPLQKAEIDIKTDIGNSSHIEHVDLVITTGAHGGYDNPEVQAAKIQGIPVLTQGEALGLFMKGEIFEREFQGISVAGCHGKTTTTAMVATIFMQAGLDPSYVIGTSNIIPLGMPGHFGKGKHFIAEADEYATEPKYDHTPKFMWQHPHILVFTNIEHDHPDIYPTIEDTRKAFLKFANNLSDKDSLIAFGDDPNIRKLSEGFTKKTVIFGYSSHNDYIIRNVRIKNDHTTFELDTQDVSLGEFSLSVTGEHNVLNATAALIVAIELGMPLDKIQQGLLAFKGTKRRFEIKGKIPSGALLIDDYGHHPTEIKKSLRAARERFKKKYIICIFQPHTYSRTKLLFDDFSTSFISVDEVILTDIYSSARENPDPSVSSELLAQSVKRFNKHVLYLPTLSDVVKYIKQKHFGENTVIITMGAGDIYTVGKALLY